MLVAALTEELKQQVLALLVPIAQLSPDYATFRAATKSCMLLDLLSTYDPDRVSSQRGRVRRLAGGVLAWDCRAF